MLPCPRNLSNNSRAPCCTSTTRCRVPKNRSSRPMPARCACTCVA
ncbi:Uncharacterised protein [Bordetella pertussis]|nr:Uncharacterised protein [Bordetella pertussis]